MSISFALETITPELAREYLARNIESNRNKKETAIIRYARDMAAGNWQPTGEAVKFDEDGNMVDGQNRLRACIMAKVSIEVLVVRGLPRDAVKRLDSGTPRSTGDQLVIGGVVERSIANEVGAIARAHFAFETGAVSNAGQSQPSGANALTNPEVIEWVTGNPVIIEAARYVKPVRRECGLPIGAIGVAYIAFKAVDIESTSEFFHRIRDRVRLGTGDPFTVLDRRIAQEKGRATSTSIPLGTALYMLFRTWNAFRANEMITKFQFGRDGQWVAIPKAK